jgi:hypothetical protein
VNNEYEGYGRKGLGIFEVLPRRLPGGAVECHEFFSQDSRSPLSDFNSGPLEHETEVILSRLRHVVRDLIVGLNKTLKAIYEEEGQLLDTDCSSK